MTPLGSRQSTRTIWAAYMISAEGEEWEGEEWEEEEEESEPNSSDILTDPEDFLAEDESGFLSQVFV